MTKPEGAANFAFCQFRPLEFEVYIAHAHKERKILVDGLSGLRFILEYKVILHEEVSFTALSPRIFTYVRSMDELDFAFINDIRSPSIIFILEVSKTTVTTGYDIPYMTTILVAGWDNGFLKLNGPACVIKECPSSAQL